MKQILLFFMMLSSTAMAQKSNCKFTKMKNAKGKVLDMVKCSGKNGNVMIGKDNGDFVIYYATKDIFDLVKPKNQANLKVDSVRINLDDQTGFTVKADWGFGIAENSNDQIQPDILTVQFTVIISSASPNAGAVTSHKITSVLVYGEKSSRYGDTFNDKQRAGLSQAFTCLQ